jgi:hypothetical protein
VARVDLSRASLDRVRPEAALHILCQWDVQALATRRDRTSNREGRTFSREPELTFVRRLVTYAIRFR